jgi:hypothetical protein
LNETIQKSTVAFTVPEQSFNDTSKLTAYWNYLGLMDNVRIPASCSRTGSEISSAQALVYIEYVGTSAPTNIPADCNLLSNADGYFYQKILGHAFTDAQGVTHTYSLKFQPTNPVNTAAQTIIYEFSSNLTDASGDPVGTGSDIEIDTMLNCLNSIQVVYKGSASNPGVALAFRSDFMPTWAATQAATTKPAATVVMVLDTSGSMSSRFSGTKRINALKSNAISLAEALSTNDKINIIIVPFGDYAGYSNRGDFTYNASTDKDALIRRINGLRASGSTNLGDGMRVAYHELNNLINSGVNTGSLFLIMMTDGEMNECSREYRNGPYYMGTALEPPFHNESGAYTIKAREYASIWGQKWISDFTLSKTWLLSLSNGMSAADKAVLEGIFGTEAIDVNSLTDFQTVFEEIGTNIDEVIWAFEGPNL